MFSCERGTPVGARCVWGLALAERRVVRGCALKGVQGEQRLEKCEQRLEKVNVNKDLKSGGCGLLGVCKVQGYLAHKKHPPPRTLQ